MDLRRRLTRMTGTAEASTAELGGLLCSECELYLAGRYADRWGPEPRGVPAWVRLNEAAHASLEHLESLAEPDALSSGISSWSDLRARLARLVVDVAAGDAARARRVQLDALVPLESRFVRRSEVVTPRGLIAAVETAIEEAVA
jgi:hypothetical protein